MEAERKNVVLSAAFGYGAETVRVLLQSARAAELQAKFVLFSNESSDSFLRQVREYYPDTDVVRPHIPWFATGFHRLNLGLKLSGISTSCLKAMLAPRNPPSAATLLVVPYFLHAALSRYFFALDYLRQNHARIGHVLLADARDIFFQSDPFNAVDSAVVSGVEDVRVKDEPFNALWLYRAYDDIQMLRAIAEQPVICSGVTIGPLDEMMNYLGAFACECLNRLDRLAWLPSFDQAIHNYLFRKSEAFGKHLVGNQDGWIMNLATASSNSFVLDSHGVHTTVGATPAIIHQYDRHPALSEFFHRRLANAR